VLGGRVKPLRAELEKIGPVVIKRYLRGGLVSSVNKKYYFYSKKTRAEHEFNTLASMKKAGVNVPTPIAHVSRGTVFYQAWLITREIKAADNFAEICRKDPKKALLIMPEICENIDRLLKNSIHHVDLHPGNIIVNGKGMPFIIDFDKACHYNGDREKLKKKYKQRWQRACSKHDLPHEISNLELG